MAKEHTLSDEDIRTILNAAWGAWAKSGLPEADDILSELREDTDWPTERKALYQTVRRWVDGDLAGE